MKKLLFMVFVSALLYSCKKEEIIFACDVKDPVNNLAWLKAKADAFEQSNYCSDNSCRMTIYKTSHQGQALIEIYVGGPAVDGAPQYYTCDGQIYNCHKMSTGCPHLGDGDLIWISKEK